MAIKALNEIPMKNRPTSARALIRADIQEALDKGIRYFEFEGDYNWQQLAGYAREVADGFRMDKVREIQARFKREKLTDEERNIRGFYLWFKAYYEYKNMWITISSMKGENRRRVFGKIDDVKEFERMILEDCEKALEDARSEYMLSDGRWVSARR